MVDRDYVLAMDFAGSQFQPPPRLKRTSAVAPRNGQKRPPRQAPGGDNGDSQPITAP